MPPSPAIALRRVRIVHFCPWAGALRPAAEFLARVSALDLNRCVSRPGDAALLRMARLDRDWHAENARGFAALAHPELEFLPARVVGPGGLADLARPDPAAADEERWLVLMAQHPQQFAAAAPALLAFLRKQGMRVLYYAYDEASRTMPCFAAIAPHLDVLIHDESPLGPAGAARLRPDCRVLHRSWVANVLPFAAPFVDRPAERILFLGSQMGLTPHRRRQIDFLQARFGDRFTAIHDHSVAVADRAALGARFKVSVCPEGRKFATPAMAATHTDRPFWSGCLGLVPVAEDSRTGGRLEALHAEGLIERYPYGDLAALAAACERALAADAAHRRRLYDHFNTHETIGSVVAAALAAAGGPA
jgi:hypothetical protein